MKITVIFLLFSQLVTAQTTQISADTTEALTSAAPEAVTEKKSVERVEVIGSRIRRIQKEGTTAVKNVNQESMKNSANTTASDTLRDSTLATYGVARESSGSNAAATTTIGLRGLGDTRTLVLLNGRRLPNDPTFEAVDLNLIPQSAIERIEVLKDGASALYGSDAIGGVVNIITKKGSAGNEISTKISGSEKKGGTSYDISGTAGVSTENWDTLFALSFNHSDKILGKNRDVTKDGLSPTAGTAAWKGVGQTTWILSNPGECPADLVRTSSSGDRCYFRYNELASTRPQIDQLNLLLDTTYRTESGAKIYFRNLVVNKNIEWNYAPAPAALSLTGGTVSNPNARNVSYRFMDAGNRDNKDSEFNFNTALGYKTALNDTFEIDTSVGYGEINRKNKGINGYLDETVIQSLITANTYDPLKPQGTQGDISAAQVETLAIAKTKLFTAESVITGEVGELDGGAIGVAAGISYLKDQLDQKTDDKSAAGHVIGSSGSNDNGERNVTSLFTEVALPFTEKLELDAAVRADQYSDFGFTANPKLSAKYKASDSVLFRASAGTGYKAPTLSQLYSASSEGYPTFIDRKKCATDPDYCTASQYLVLGGGNKDLKEEKSVALSFGAIYQASAKTAFSLDSWFTQVKNLVSIDYEDVTQAELNGVDTTQSGVTVVRDAGTGEITEIQAKNLNLGENEIAGIDFNFETELPVTLKDMTLQFTNEFSLILFDKYEGFPGAGKRDTIGEWGKPNWRNSATLSLKNDSSKINLTLRSLPGQNVSDRTIDRKISDLNEWDLSAAHTFAMKQQLSMGIKNLMDAKQPLDVGGGSGGANEINNSLYDVNGRKFFVSFSQKF
jgi:iron complex outermembrane receptor protein